jgi:hypothetical protein
MGKRPSTPKKPNADAKPAPIDVLRPAAELNAFPGGSGIALAGSQEFDHLGKKMDRRKEAMDKYLGKHSQLAYGASLLEEMERGEGRTNRLDDAAPDADAYFDEGERWVLKFLLSCPTAPCKQHAIAKGTRLSHGTVSKAVNSLLSAGHLCRPLGARKGVALSEAGRLAAKSVTQIAR